MTLTSDAFVTRPLDADLLGELRAGGLDARLLDPSVRGASDPWIAAVARGFLGDEPNDARRETFATVAASRRHVGVHDGSAPQPEVPVATFASWLGELTLPGGSLQAAAISSVTVAPTHRRRGLLRALMTGELRTAAESGVPIAALTVSESSIYGRFGFAPAAVAAQWELDVRRAGWIGPHAPGRVDFTTRAAARDLAEALHERVRVSSPGELSMPNGHWDRFFGTRADADKPERLRAVQYRTPAGEIEGVALYAVSENHDDFAASTLELTYLLAASDEAYAGLWRFFLSMDLIGVIRASELAVDEPLWWMIADQRAAKISLRDHHYLRILDVPAALAARTYDVADAVALTVDDRLGIAGGSFVLETDAGAPSVRAVDEPPAGLPHVALGIADLSALLAGGISAVTLARAGRVQTDEPARLARLFQSPAAPRLSYWY